MKDMISDKFPCKEKDSPAKCAVIHVYFWESVQNMRIRLQ